MEFAIIAGIGMVGYHLSQGGAETRPSKDEAKRRLPRVDAYPFHGCQGVAKRVRRFEDKAKRRWEQSLMPHMTGIVSPNMARYATEMQRGNVHSNMIPNFRSARTQHMAPEQESQRRMEMFTGATDMDTSATGTYRRKIEVQLPHPNTPVAVSSSGTSGNGASVPDADRYIAGTRHNNVSPVPQIRVGPGLGLSADAPATDGFHPTLRVLPVNIAAYTRNNLPGAVNHGGSQNASGTVRPKFVKNRPDKPMATTCNRKMERERSAVTAPMVRSDEGRDAVGRLAGGPYFGGAAAGAATGAQTAGTVHDIAEGRVKLDTYHGTPAMNLGNEKQGVGGFVNTYVDPARFDSQQRETPGGFGFLQAQGPGARASAAGQLLPPTQRDMNRLDPLQHLNVMARTTNTQTRPMHSPPTTLRESVLRDQQILNPTAPYKASMMDNETRRYETVRDDAKRASQVTGYVPLPGRTNVFEVAAMGVTRVRDDDTATCAPNHGIMKSAARYGEALGELTTSYNKLPPMNPRIDQMDVAREQLRGNDLAVGPLLS